MIHTLVSLCKNRAVKSRVTCDAKETRGALQKVAARANQKKSKAAVLGSGKAFLLQMGTGVEI